jgi:hypothetical protein
MRRFTFTYQPSTVLGSTILLLGVMGAQIGSAQAATLNGNRNELKGINDLQIGSTLYKVEFKEEYKDIAGKNAAPQFNVTAATQAVDAINAFFNLSPLNFGDLSSEKLDGEEKYSYLVPFLLAGTGDNATVTSKQSTLLNRNTSSGNWVLSTTNKVNSQKSESTYAKFTATGVVPVPTPALLPGLVGMGLSFWRKQKEEVQV